MSGEKLAALPGLVQSYSKVTFTWLGYYVFHAVYAFGRSLSEVCGYIWEKLSAFFSAVPGALLKALKWILEELLAPVTVMIKAVRTVSHHLRSVRGEPLRDRVSCYGASALYLLVQLIKALLHLLNYVAPALAVMIFVVVVRYYQNVDYALRLKYDGVAIGYVSDLTVYDEAEELLWDRLDSINLTKDDIRQCSVSYSVAFVSSRRFSTASELTDRMIQQCISDLTEAYGVYVDGEYWGAILEGEEMQAYLDERLELAQAAMTTTPVTEETSVDTEDGEEEDTEEESSEESFTFTGEVEARFLRDVEISKGYYPLAGIVDPESFYETFNSIVAGEELYVCQAGDSAWSIAASLPDVTLEELYAMNPWLETGNLYPGDEVVTSQEVPYLQVELAAQITYTEEIEPELEKVESSSYNQGYQKITDEGTPGEKQVVANIVYRNGVEVGREIVSETVTVEPVAGTMVVGTKAVAYTSSGGSYYDAVTSSASNSNASGSFCWPVNGGYVSCGWYGYAGHRGMDICAPAGTDIYAADGGVVVVSCRNDSIGYGNYIVIDHGNGYKTLYAHCSARYVSVGQYVTKGQVIAAVGRTGWATGNHLHIEVWINNQKVNPAKYIYR